MLHSVRAAGLGACLTAFVATLAMSVDAKPAKDPTKGPLVIDKQGSFFVGGRVVTSDTLSLTADRPSSGDITVDQIYVHYQVPLHAEHAPKVVFIHGCCLTGKTWETTPDGRMGWDEYFVRLGFPTYVIDQSWRGRSASDPSAINAAHMGKAPIDKIPTVASTARQAAWTVFRFGPKYGETFPGERFPVKAADELYKQMVPDEFLALPIPNPTVPNLVTLSQQLGRTVLVSHSQSGPYPFQAAAISTQGIAGIVAIEPSACPDAAGDLTPYKAMPILIVWGDYVSLSDRWAPRLKGCRAFADAMAKAGGRVTLTVLPEQGVHGNTHMMMQDDNSLQIADILARWIRKTVE